MEAPQRGALMLVRFVAAALIGWAVIELSLYIVICRHKAVPVEVMQCVVKAIPLILGTVILVKDQAIAEWVSDKLDL
ncbi:MAG: hypothetical protein JF609_01560 [Verrucomicrobia bacterium]|nr:hypothetical protein [Verrucomicrobiota bacterium]